MQNRENDLAGSEKPMGGHYHYLMTL